MTETKGLYYLLTIPTSVPIPDLSFDDPFPVRHFSSGVVVVGHGRLAAPSLLVGFDTGQQAPNLT